MKHTLRHVIPILLFALALGKWNTATAQASFTSCQIIVTVGGNGTAGFTGDGGAATAAEMYQPTGVALDGSGNMYIVDMYNYRVRKISSAGVITTVAGNGTYGYSGDGGPATAAELYLPVAVTLDHSGNLYIADEGNNRIRKVTPSGIISTVAGTGTAGYSGDGGAATAAAINSPWAVAVDSTGNMIIADRANNRLRRVNTSGIITTIAGNGTAGFAADGSVATSSMICTPEGVVLDASGNIYFSDHGNNRIRKITSSGLLYTLAGNGTGGFSGDGGAATSAEIYSPCGVARDNDGNIYFADNGNNRVREISTSGYIFTIAGTGTAGYSGDGGMASTSEIYAPYNIAADASGNIYICDAGNQRLREVTAGIPALTAITGATTVAAGSAITLSDATTGGTWFSYNTSIATIDSTGTLRGVAAGRDTILYSVTGACGTSYALYVVTVTSSVASISGPASVCTGSTISLSDATTGGTWTSSNTAVASVGSASGVVYGISAGSVTISYTTSSGTATSHITVLGSPSAGAISGASTVCAGSTITLIDSISGGTWSSSNTAIATVGSTGVVAGVSAGTTVITYVVTNVCGTGYATKTITVTSGSSVGAITGASTVCVGSSITLSDATSGGTWSCSTTTVATVSAAGVVYGLAAGTATITYAVTGSCGTGYATKTITVGSGSSSAGSISGASTVCAGSTITLIDSISGGTWSSSNTMVASVSSTTGVVRGDSTGTATITYTVTGSCGTAYTTKTITVTSGSSVSGITGASTVCVGSSIILSDATSGGSWSSANVAVATVDASGMVHGVSSGTVTITYAVSGSCGTGYATKTITVGSGSSSAGSISGASTVCAGSTITLIDSISGGTWSSNNTMVASVGSTTGVVRGDSVGTATITYTVTGSCGTAYTTKTITVTSGSSVGAITGASTVCVGSSITLTDATSGGTWSCSTTTVATVSAAGVVYGLAAGTATITYAVTGSCGTGYATKTITVGSGSSSAGSISGASTVCAGSTITLFDSISGGTWSSNNTMVASVGSTTGVVRGDSVGTATITYTISGSCGTVYATKTITVTGIPTVGAISGASTVCTGGSITLSDATPGGTWFSYSTSIATVSSTGTVYGLAAGIDTIVYMVSGGSCGSANATKVITVSAGASAGTISGPTTVCSGSTIALTDAATGGVWTSSNSAIATVNSTTGMVSGVAAGTASISYSVTSTCGTSVAGHVVTVSGGASAGTITGPTTVCTGSTITLSDATSGGTWSSSNTATATVTSGGTVTGVSAGTVNITYTVTSSCATSSAVATITVGAAATTGTISGLGSVCTGSYITLTSSGTAGGTWTSSNTAVATVGGGIVHGVAGGSVMITYSVTSSCGTVYSTKAVTVMAAPAASPISGLSNICLGSTSTYTDATAGGGWISSNTLVATISASGVATAVRAGTATITYFVTNSCGTATVTKPITVNSLSAGIISGASSIAAGSACTYTSSVTGGAWSVTNTSLAAIGTSGVLTGIAAGTDTIKYTVTNVCGTASSTKVVCITAHRDEMPEGTSNQSEINVNLFPNPNSGTFTLQLTGTTGSANVLITDLTGRVLDVQTSTEQRLYFDLSRYAAGTYIVKIDVDGQTMSRKVMVQ